MDITCIICKKPKNEKEFNEEHVFPDSIGGEYKIHNVCKDCNSHLGKTIDSKFIQSGAIRALNHKLKVENKNGKVVPYFQDIIVNPEDKSIRLKPEFDNKGNLKNTEFETTVHGNTVRFDETKSINTLLSELNILYKKDKIPFLKDIENEEEKKKYFLEFKEQIKEKFENNEFSSSKDPIEQISITTGEEIILESLKISYELTHKILGEKYFNDPICEIFRKCLEKGKLENNIDYEINFKGVDKSISHAINFHYFILINMNNTLTSIVILYNTFISTFTVSEDSSKNKHLPLYNEISSLWKNHFSHVGDVTFDRISQKSVLLSAMEKIEVRIVNGSKQSASLNYKENPSLRVIAVGGLALSRGLTLEGLMVSYFYRNTATFDVLMQMGRWFGYRRGYEDLFQIWTSQTSAMWYAEISRASAELKNDIREMFDQRLTPKDFGIKVRDNCDELQITAYNKMRSAVGKDMMYSFYGNIYDTPYITSKIEHNKINKQKVKDLVASLFEQGYLLKYADYKKSNKDVNNPSDGSSRYFADVPKSIVIEFLRGIKYSMANPRFDAKNIIDFLEDEGTEGMDLWDVVFESGKADDHYDVDGLRLIKCMKRAIFSTNRNIIQLSARRRVLTGSIEGRFALSKDDIDKAEQAQRNQWEEDGEDSQGRAIPVKAYFKFLPQRKPILVIMFIKPQPPEGDEDKMLIDFREALGQDCIVAFAVGSPGIQDEGKAIKYQVNKIYQQLNMEGEEPEEEDDDE